MAAVAGQSKRRKGAIHESFLVHRGFYYLKLATLLCLVVVVGYIFQDARPRLLDVWTPWSKPRLLAENARGLHSLSFDFGHYVLRPGAASSLGSLGGERVQLSYDLDQSPWHTEDDYSLGEQPLDAAWHVTTRVQLLGRNDAVLYGWARPADEPLLAR